MKIATYSESNYLTCEAPSSIRQDVIPLNLASVLRAHLKLPCRPLIEGVKLGLRKEQSYFYPNVMAIQGR